MKLEDLKNIIDTYQEIYGEKYTCYTSELSEENYWSLILNGYLIEIKGAYIEIYKPNKTFFVNRGDLNGL